MSFENVEFISAGAGSGKTYSLMQRLSAVLDSGEVTPKGVVATTFTRLAAGELRERVRESLMQSGKRDLANQMGQAAINTVNSVCGELLKRFAFEAGLSPEQVVLEDGEAKLLFAEAVDVVLDRNRDEIEPLNTMAYRLGFFDKGVPTWRSDVRSIADAARANNCSLEQLPVFAEESAESLLAHFRKPIKRDVNNELLSLIATALDSIDLTLDTTKVTKGYVAFLQEISTKLNSNNLTWSEWVSLHNNAPGAKSRAHAEPIQILAGDYESHPLLHQDIQQYIERVFSLAANCLDEYKQLKIKQGLIDFVDQELQLYELLDDEHVKAVLSDELQLLMVDEFQDTSPIQLALFVRMAALADKVIWVGDIKQAIYGFRGSDPLLMSSVLNAILASGGGSQVLEDSWRSRPALVKYCNEVFTGAFANTISKQKVRLNPQREEVNDAPAVMHWSLSGNWSVKASSVAAGIKQLINEKYPVVDKETELSRPVRYGDIAVLCRSHDRLAQLADACFTAGINVGFKRAGLLSTPEGVLTLACLRRLVDPTDTLASAEIITLVKCDAPDSWLANRLSYLEEGGKPSRWGEEGEDALKQLADLAATRSAIDLLTPTEVLREAIAKGRVREVVSQWGANEYRVKARLANIDSLQCLAEEYQQHCESRNIAATASGLVMWLNQLAEEEGDTQAVTQDDDTVTLVTHHGSKGLEWPVVIVVDLEKEVRNRLWGQSVLPRSDTLDVNAPLAGRSIRFWPYAFGAKKKGIPVCDRIVASEAGKAAIDAAIEEEKRLLYVSLTRPRDLLVMPLSSKGVHQSLGVLNTDWMVPNGNSLELPSGATIPTASTSHDPALEVGETNESFTPYWFKPTRREGDILLRKFNPSAMLPVVNATVGAVLELGERMAIGKVEDMSTLGNALHSLIALAINQKGNLKSEQVLPTLKAYGVDQSIDMKAVIDIARRFYSASSKQFNATAFYPEYPIQLLNDKNQEAIGFIDLLIDTPSGWIIIDHKSSPAPRTDWEANALSYSGQLACYKAAIEQLSGKPVLSCWIHFAITGGLVEVV